MYLRLRDVVNYRTIVTKGVSLTGKQTDEKLNKILTELKGMTYQQAKFLLEIAIESLASNAIVE